MERGLDNYLLPQYNPGVMVSYLGRSLELEVGGFGQRQDLAQTSQSSSLRMAYVYRVGEGSLTQFDVSVRRLKFVDDSLEIGAAPEGNLILPLYSASQSNIDSATSNGLGVTLIYGSFNYAAQVSQMDLTTANPGITQLSSKNLWISWLSGGNHRRFRAARWLPITSDKAFSEVDWGHWELGFRYSSLEDNTEEHLITKTLMVNWYVNRHITVKNNYIFATQVASPTDPARPIDNDADLFFTRLQFAW